MPNIVRIALFSALLQLGALPAFAGEQVVKLSVPGMFCASCPFIVKQAISGVDGIALVETSLEERTATVIFDDERTSVDAITQATADVGYPATVIEADGQS